jgi:tagatose 1,6-diphosphate aldolase
MVAMKRRNRRGVLLENEKSPDNLTVPKSLSLLTEGWSVRRLKAAAVSAIKVLPFYCPFENHWKNGQKKLWAERIGARPALTA